MDAPRVAQSRGHVDACDATCFAPTCASATEATASPSTMSTSRLASFTASPPALAMALCKVFCSVRQEWPGLCARAPCDSPRRCRSSHSFTALANFDS